MTIRTLFLSPGVHRHGGAERCLIGLLDGLDGMDVGRRVVVFGEGDLADHLRERGEGVAVVPLINTRPTARYRGGLGVITSAAAAAPAVPRAIRGIRAEMRRFEPDIVHSNGTRAHLLLPFLRRKGTSSVATLHDLPVTRTERRIMAVPLRGADAVIANSPLVAEEYERAAVSCKVIDNPVATPARRDGRAARERFGLPVDAFVVASLSHFHWNKSQLDLVHAIEQLEDDCHLVLAGGPLYGRPSHEYLEEVTVAAASSTATDRIHLVGVQDDVSWLYAAADVVAHCSVRSESFGMAIVEALLTNTAVVSSTAGTPGQMLEDGRTALLYPPGDVAELVRCLDLLRREPQRRVALAREGRAWASGRFSPEHHAAAVFETYETLAGHPRRQCPPTVSEQRR